MVDHLPGNMMFFHRKRLTKQTPSKAIDDLIKLQVAPLLKSKGFLKESRTWRKSLPGTMLIVSIQASRWNGAETGASFVVNYGIYKPEVHHGEPRRSEIIAPKESDWEISKRVTRKRGQIWWDIYDHTNTGKLSKDLVQHIETQCFPFFDEATRQ